MILLLDNYDSFVYNLDRYLQQLGHNTLVVRSDAISVDSIRKLQLNAIVISPGPKTPDDAGCSLEVVRKLSGVIPILGVCLGHQAIGQAFGARVVRCPTPIHGKSSWIQHTESALFHGLPARFQVGRYHSLMIDRDSLPESLLATAWTEDGTIMAVEHRECTTWGVQFHPESILTSNGYRILANFLIAAGLKCDVIPRGDLSSTAIADEPWLQSSYR